MSYSILLKILFGLLGFTYIGLQALELEIFGSGVSLLMLLCLTVLYFKYSKVRHKYFLWFLIAFTLAQLATLISYLLPIAYLQTVDFSYYFTNALYIVSYVFLIVHITKSMNAVKTLKRFKGPIIILLVLDVFCVFIVTDAAAEQLNMTQYILEFTYNGVIMGLLSVALLNYLSKDNNKTMLFLIGSIFIVFSEIIQLAYFYVMSSNDLSATYATFLVMAFLFFYWQSQLKQEEHLFNLENEEITA